MSKITRQTLAGLLLIVLFLAFMISHVRASISTDSFIQSATIGNQFEISSSRLALQKSQNEDIKPFAQQMVNDHTQAANDMKTVIASEGATQPSQPTIALDHEHQKMVDKLNKLSSVEFDKQYVKMQVKAHNDAVSLFRDYAKNGDNASLKSFAAQTLPTLKEHQQHIKEIASNM